ncbi:MAG TPA: sulfotransferase domain-containing protein [Caulobacteraceae bacterium]|nr:sulfotransferase domain-containing protein [Caulobacteraceae bacterium]
MNDAAPHRARSLDEFRQLQGQFFRGDEIAASIASYRPRPTDVVISPFGKCGTTWLQQTFHTLRTRGDMDFDDISRVVPWIETAGACGLDLEAPQRAEPRGFKSHLTWDRAPEGARYVVSLRDPKDAMVSHFRFMEGWFFEPGAIALGEYLAATLADRRPGHGYWSHLLGWWAQRRNPDVLLVSYEHMSADPEANVRRLAGFCGIALDEALLALTLQRTSLAFMLAHKDRFDDAMMRRLSEERCGLPPGGDSAKVREGKVGANRKQMPAEIAAAFDARWAEEVTPELGFSDYAALEAALRRDG